MAQHKTLDELKKILTDFEQENWVAPIGEQGQTRHITLHMAKLMGKLGTVTEGWEHNFEMDLTQLKTEVIPDLLYYAIALAKVHGVNLEEAFLNRLEMNKKKVGRWREEGKA